MFPHTPAKSVDVVVNKYIERYKATEPIFDEFDILEAKGVIKMTNIALFWASIGLLFVLFWFWEATF